MRADAGSGHSITPDPARGLSEGRNSTGKALRVRCTQSAGKDFPETSVCLTLCKVRKTVLPLGNSHVRAGNWPNVFCKGPGSEYFRLCDGPCHSYSALPALCSSGHRQKFKNERGCVPIKFYLWTHNFRVS